MDLTGVIDVDNIIMNYKHQMDIAEKKKKCMEKINQIPNDYILKEYPDGYINISRYVIGNKYVQYFHINKRTDYSRYSENNKLNIEVKFDDFSPNVPPHKTYNITQIPITHSNTDFLTYINMIDTKNNKFF